MATISRAVMTREFPCSSMLVCAMNPCPCGYPGDPGRRFAIHADGGAEPAS